ncbi:MAG: glycyl-radical enzyme activating protein [Bacteroidetes bacterium]|nr:glycyl-radical enzyme activating protein [Bacteroidota bacterium]
MGHTELINGRIFDIQGFSVHDGPGCRTLIFFKGCSLECAWCSNPEGISRSPEPLYRHSKCTFDGRCVNACPYGAISLSNNGEGDQLTFNRSICVECTSYICSKACLSGALNIGGYTISVEDLYTRIKRDRQFWGDGGGITLTGGEPLIQPEFARDFLKRCYEAYIHTAIETCGNVPWENYKMTLPFIDWIFYDLKTMDESKHHHFTKNHMKQFNHSPVALILENARRIAREFSGRLVFRMPVIPGFNDDNKNIDATAHFIQSTGRNEINILPLHHLGREKYSLLEKKYSMTDLTIPSKDELRKIAHQFSSLGITCYAGSETPF